LAGEKDQEGEKDLEDRDGWRWMKPQSWEPQFLQRGCIRGIRMRAR
jgi:hypothetical protein